ncbi:MAG: hypothetical protein K2V38_23200, partial [Gemmataceae bacterium]|nr:hypothetical protein [Gemmataceae bacterium]
MATVQAPAPATARPVEPDRALTNPLDRLRGTIRRYVVLEGALSAVLFVVAWYCLGLVCDFVFFKLTGVDWVLDAPGWLRTTALLVAVLVFVAIVGFRIVRRVRKEFSYPALALVLERKFPKLLGDRLITAVELADVEAMGRFGYSKDMIRATIAEARARVAQVPVNDVFDWRRLWRLGAVSVALLFATFAVAFASHAVALRSVEPVRFGWKFAHVTGIFLERNAALMNTPWPRRAHVELVGFPETEYTVSREIAAVPVTARLYKWVVADRSAREGWRPMRWSDVTPDLVGAEVPAFDLQALATADEKARGGVPTDPAAWTVDAVEDRARRPDTLGEDTSSDEAKRWAALGTALGEDFGKLQSVFKALDAQADKPSMGRTLRKLDLTRQGYKKGADGKPVLDEDGNKVWGEVELGVRYAYSGQKFRGSGDLKKEAGDYKGEIKDLKEDVTFVLKADDFETAPRRVRLIPPPTLKRLYRVQEEPAYLHHPVPVGATADYLRGKRQLMAEKNLSLTGERTVFAVPAGTQVTLHAEAYAGDDGQFSDNDRIISAVARPRLGRFPGAVFGEDGKMTQTAVPLKVNADGTGFSLTFRNLAEGFDPTTAVGVAVLQGVYPAK